MVFMYHKNYRFSICFGLIRIYFQKLAEKGILHPWLGLANDCILSPISLSTPFQYSATEIPSGLAVIFSSSSSL